MDNMRLDIVFYDHKRLSKHITYFKPNKPISCKMNWDIEFVVKQKMFLSFCSFTNHWVNNDRVLSVFVGTTTFLSLKILSSSLSKLSRNPVIWGYIIQPMNRNWDITYHLSGIFFVSWYIVLNLITILPGRKPSLFNSHTDLSVSLSIVSYCTTQIFQFLHLFDSDASN